MLDATPVCVSAASVMETSMGSGVGSPTPQSTPTPCVLLAQLKPAPVLGKGVMPLGMAGGLLWEPHQLTEFESPKGVL